MGDKCDDNCEQCTVQDCASGADGNCEWNSNIEQCVGKLCQNNCENCEGYECEDSFAPMGCMLDWDESSEGFQENCMKWEEIPFRCSDLNSSETACSNMDGCWWMPFTSPPRCGSLDKCKDNCQACNAQQCGNIPYGIGGNSACRWNSYSEQCEGIECNTNCDECDTIPNRGTDYCNDSPFGCEVTPNNELCLQKDVRSLKIEAIPLMAQLVSGDTFSSLGWDNLEIQEKLHSMRCLQKRVWFVENVQTATRIIE